MEKIKNRNELFEDLNGQKFARTFLESVIQKKRINTAYLFSGPNGVGRKLTALRFLEGLLNDGQTSIKDRRRLETCNHPDLLWIEPTYKNQGKLITKSKSKENEFNEKTPPIIRLEQIREVTSFLGKKPIEAKLGMVVIDGVETMAEAAANALLKTLEEPGNGVLILITSRPEKLLQTILSRCQLIPFYPLNKDDFKKVIIKQANDSISEMELKKVFNEKELNILSNGSPGSLIENIKMWNDIPNNLWPRLKDLPQKSIDSLSLAKDITETMNVEQQIWLINWLQINLWEQKYNSISSGAS